MIPLPDVRHTKGVPGTKLLEVIYGSHAHGTATPTSDVDVRGVYMLPVEDFLGIHTPKTTWENKAEDRVFWELGHFVRLLLKGNPNLVGLLFADTDTRLWSAPPIGDLLRMREKFLTQSFRKAYMGWIHREAEDLAKMHKGHAKRLSHMPRLIWELESVYQTGQMVVRPDEDKRQRIVDIKTGAMDYDEAFAWVGELIVDMEHLDEEVGPSLPEPPYDDADS